MYLPRRLKTPQPTDNPNLMTSLSTTTREWTVKPATSEDISNALQLRLQLASDPVPHASSSAWFDAPVKFEQPRPCIRFECSCQHKLGGSGVAKREGNELDSDSSQPPPHEKPDAFNLFQLEDLLYCDRCHCLKCPHCVNEELMECYCPNCLFDTVMTSVTRGDRNRCIRHCFMCPLCSSSCSIVGLPRSWAPPPPSTTPSASSTPPSTPPQQPPQQPEDPFKYVVQCNHCHWASTSTPEWVFDKPTGLGATATLRDSRSVQAQAFQSLKAHLQASLPQPAKTTTASRVTQLLAKVSRKFGTSQTRLGSATDLFVNDGIEKKKKEWERQPWKDPSGAAYVEPEEGTDDEKAERYEAWLKAKTAAQRQQALDARRAGQTTSLEQRLGQPMQAFGTLELVPARMPLRAKKIKRCPECTTILVRPEPKVANVKWRIKSVARDVIPKITMVPPLPPQSTMDAGPSQSLLILRFANPLEDVSLPITLSLDPDTTNSSTTLLTRMFTLPPKQEENLYEVEDDPLDQEEWATVVGKAGGIVKRRNWVAVGLMVDGNSRSREVGIKMAMGEGGKLDAVYFVVRY